MNHSVIGNALNHSLHYTYESATHSTHPISYIRVSLTHLHILITRTAFHFTLPLTFNTPSIHTFIDLRPMVGECANQLRMSVRPPTMVPPLVRWQSPEILGGGFDTALQGNLYQRVRGVITTQ